MKRKKLNLRFLVTLIAFMAMFVPTATLKAQDCSAPQNLTAIAERSAAKITWQPSSNGETRYQYVYCESGETPDWSNATNAFDTTCVLKNLSENTTYVFYVRSYCSPDDQSVAVQETFTTGSCCYIPNLSGSFDFEDYTAGSNPNDLQNEGCWTVANIKTPTSSTYYKYIPYVYYDNNHGKSLCMTVKYNSFPMLNYSCAYAIMPDIYLVDSIKNYYLNFYMTSTSTSNVQLDVCILNSRNITDISHTYQIDLDLQSSTYHVDFSDYTGDSKYIMFRAQSTSTNDVSFYFDEIGIYERPDTFDTDGNWSDSSNWSRGFPPHEWQDVVIDANCTIDSGYKAFCDFLYFDYYGHLTVSSTASLTVNRIHTGNGDHMTLKSDQNGTGTLFVKETNSSSGGLILVEMYFKGMPSIYEDYVVHEWQYRGIIGEFASFVSYDNMLSIYRWDETNNNQAFDEDNTGCWVETGTLAPWNGYSMASDYDSEENLTVSYKTSLFDSNMPSMNQGKTYSNLTYTGDGSTANCGVNLLTNSFSAPIDMAASGIEMNNLDSTFYFFNTCSHSSWEDDPDAAITTYPLETGSETDASPLIPAGQSFAVKAKSGGGSLTIPASAILGTHSGPMYAPRKKSKYGVLKLTAKSDDGLDKLFLLESDLCDKEFNNGYDGTKMFSSKAPQIYATNDYGMTAVNADNTLLGQYIGVRQTTGSPTITLTITRKNLDNYTELSLYDCANGTYTDLGNDETVITFTATGDDSRRFLISGKREDGLQYTPTEDERLVVAGGELRLINFVREDAQIILTDISGRILWTESSRNGFTFTLPELPAGVYFIKCGNATTKYITK